MSGGLPRLTTRRTSDLDVLHGVEVRDPYRWLEDGEAAEVATWVDAQNARTRDALGSEPSRGPWHRRLVELMELPVVQSAQLRGDRMVLLERPAGADQARLVVCSASDPSTEVGVLVDPAADADDGAVAIDWYEASPDGTLVAFGVSEGGTENSVLRAVLTDGGDLLDVQIPNCRAASVAWEPDGSGFFYTRYPDGDQYHRTVHHHRLGAGRAADGTDDPVVWDRHPTPEAWPTVELSPNGRWLKVRASVGWSRTDIELLDRDSGSWRPVIVGVDATSAMTFEHDDALVGVTTLQAPRGRVVRVGLGGDDLGPDTWQTVVAERDVIVSGVAVDHRGLIVTTSDAGVDALERWNPDGSGHRVLDGLGLSSVVQVSTDAEGNDAVAILTGFERPASVWRVGATDVGPLHPDGSIDALPDLTVRRVRYASPDGTQVGLFLIHRADKAPNADTPTILNGYGGFAITESPAWSPMIGAWCATGGLYAIAGLRGGFEHGDDWHRAGRREHKQNVFDDFHAAADWLVDSGLTSRDRLAVTGGSNGGLLVGAALTQRPDLCRAVWCAVPLLDMVRFPQFLIARLWTDEYGDPDVADEFEWLWSYSPYHRVQEGVAYPAVLLTTAEGDSRVDPLHARKMAAMLQWASTGQDDRPVLLHQEGRAGHGVGKPVGKRAAEQADVLAFLTWQLGVETT